MARSRTQIRVVSGELGGLYIETPKTEATHPMGERERQAIFNRIRDDIDGKTILDAFAGSGVIGFESISLGAASVDFLENNSEAIKTIRQNIDKLKLNDFAKAGNIRVLRRIDGLSEQGYDIIFADPPYDKTQYELVQNIVTKLKNGGLFILSHPANPEPPIFENLELLSDKKYAAAHIKIYQKSAK